ncbi:hypothetical protein [Pusillimonas sp. ANT_WB101]|uniref:hypothetical protein n=1 Tax=Pusillimonas sp. ANT_WB101 TaxID=2597356 RepID=UPI0011EE8579|nr:hypothetical protein [Pusillimonas sp. ANT_WB101]KAA0892532.1 hypothetical protein FQ179_09430 [Pusillimonas sp. ANT_WB101]
MLNFPPSRPKIPTAANSEQRTGKGEEMQGWCSAFDLALDEFKSMKAEEALLLSCLKEAERKAGVLAAAEERARWFSSRERARCMNEYIVRHISRAPSRPETCLDAQIG